MATPARDRLLRAAGRRFYAHGICGTGVDSIVTEAGVAKMSLYNNFSSKDDLVVAYLEMRHAEWLALLEARLSETFGQDRILAVFDAYLDHARLAHENGFRGCGGLNGAAELPVGHPGRDAVRRHKDEVRQRLVELCVEGGIDEATRVGEHLYLLAEGGVVAAGLAGTLAHLETARTIAERVLNSEVQTSPA